VAAGAGFTRPCTVVVRPGLIRMLFADPAGPLTAGAVIDRHGSASMRFRSSSAQAIEMPRHPHHVRRHAAQQGPTPEQHTVALGALWESRQ
jgi:hypothetical protein